MSIEAGHWAIVVHRVREHARQLHPRDEKARQKLANYLLGTATKEDQHVLLEELESHDFRNPRKPSLFKRFLSFFKT